VLARQKHGQHGQTTSFTVWNALWDASLHGDSDFTTFITLSATESSIVTPLPAA
jgi:hypothetical protein